MPICWFEGHFMTAWLSHNHTPPFVSQPPKVKLVNAFAEPYNNAIATARTCYSSRVIETQDVAANEKACASRDAIAQSTYAAGHHTIWQHAAFQFSLENVSRQCIWSFLHAHPFYNSEQASQRYVAVHPDAVVIPNLAPDQLALYQQTLQAQMQCYRGLVDILQPVVEQHYFKLFPARKKKSQKYAKAIQRKAQEVARYALPIATFAHLYHTISGLTLYRYVRLCKQLDVPTETKLVVDSMVEQVKNRDPLFFTHVQDPLPLEETLEYQLLIGTGEIGNTTTCAKIFCAEFDKELQTPDAVNKGGSDCVSRLVGYTSQAEELLASAVRQVLGLARSNLSDAEAMHKVLSPKQNPYVKETLNLSSLSKVSRVCMLPFYVFQKKLSHSADSQEQRHRLTPGTRPVLHAHYMGGEPDVILPSLLHRNSEAEDLFLRTMKQTWKAMDSLLADNVSEEMALYLLPNAFPVRFYESGDLASFRHKWTTRLCYNAQEEIWAAGKQELEAVKAVHPNIAKHMGPWCWIRKEACARPICPEGSRYCGVRVWEKHLSDVERVL